MQTAPRRTTQQTWWTHGLPPVGNADRRVEVSFAPPARPQATLEDGLFDAVTAELLLHCRDAPGRRERPHRGGGSDRRAGPPTLPTTPA